MRMGLRLANLKQRHDWRSAVRALPDVTAWHEALYLRFETWAWLKGQGR